MKFGKALFYTTEDFDHQFQVTSNGGSPRVRLMCRPRGSELWEEDAEIPLDRDKATVLIRWLSEVFGLCTLTGESVTAVHSPDTIS